MGKIAFGFSEYLDQERLKVNVNYLQELVVKKIDGIFNSEYIFELNFNYEIGIGERGHFNEKENYLFSIKFNYMRNYCFEFYLFYDQLEYFIVKESKIIKSCNLEDYTENIYEMVETFIKYLVRDLEKLKIPYQNGIF